MIIIIISVRAHRKLIDFCSLLCVVYRDGPVQNNLNIFRS